MGTTRVAPRPPYAAAAIGGGTLLLLALATTAGDSPISPCAAADHHATELLVEIIHDDPHRAAIYGPQLGQAVDRLATARRYCAYGCGNRIQTTNSPIVSDLRPLLPGPPPLASLGGRESCRAQRYRTPSRLAGKGLGLGG